MAQPFDDDVQSSDDSEEGISIAVPVESEVAEGKRSRK